MQFYATNIENRAISIWSAITSAEYLTINSAISPSSLAGDEVKLNGERLLFTNYYGNNSSISYKGAYNGVEVRIDNFVNGKYIRMNSTSIADTVGRATLTMSGSGFTTNSINIATVGKILGQQSSACDESIKSHKKSISTLNRLKQIRVESYQYNTDAINAKYKTIADSENDEIDKENEIIKLENLSKPEHEQKTLKPHVKPFSCGKDKTPIKKIGVYAEEFNTVFGVNDGSKDDVLLMDCIGVALASIKELAQQLDDLKRQVRSYKRILNITDEQIAEERDRTAIRKLEIAKARQAKRVTLEITAIKEHESPLDLEEIDDVEK